MRLQGREFNKPNANVMLSYKGIKDMHAKLFSKMVCFVHEWLTVKDNSFSLQAGQGAGAKRPDHS